MKPQPEFRYEQACRSIAETMEKCKCPLSGEQALILTGALAIWIPEPNTDKKIPRSQGEYVGSVWPFGKNRQNP